MAGVRIRVHASFLLLFLLVLLVGAATTLQGALAETGWILIIFACVVIHELAHSVTALRLGTRVRDIVRLGWLNVLLAGFNLLPVLPMDGGRLLRAGLERRLGRTGSTIAAARIGRIGGALLIAVGFFYDVWLLFIGAFILLGASAEGADAQAHQRLSGLRVESAMIRAPWTAEAHLYVDQPGLDQAMARQAILPVTSAGAFLGVLGPAQRPLLAEVRFSGDVADREAPAVGPEEPLDHALDAIQQGSQPGVAVLAPDRSVIGVVTLEALRRALTSTVGASA